MRILTFFTVINKRLPSLFNEAACFCFICVSKLSWIYPGADVDFLAPPAIDASRNDVSPRVTIGRPVTLWCSVSGHPFPTITWKKDGVEVQRKLFRRSCLFILWGGHASASDTIRILDDGQMLEILDTKREHAGTWMCTAENDAGARELEIQLDVWSENASFLDSLYLKWGNWFCSSSCRSCFFGSAYKSNWRDCDPILWS